MDSRGCCEHELNLNLETTLEHLGAKYVVTFSKLGVTSLDLLGPSRFRIRLYVEQLSRIVPCFFAFSTLLARKLHSNWSTYEVHDSGSLWNSSICPCVVISHVAKCDVLHTLTLGRIVAPAPHLSQRFESTKTMNDRTKTQCNLGYNHVTMQLY